MSKSRVAGLVASASLLLALFVVLPGMGADEKEKEKNDALYRPLGLFTEVLGLVRSNYVEPVELKPLLSGAFSGMTEALDPFSEYVPPDKMAAFTAWEASKEKKDVVDTGLVLARRFGYPVVVAAVEGSPAAAAGVKSDDVVEKVDGQLTRNMPLWELDAKLSGKAGGRVRLEVVREGKPRHRTIDIVRASWSPATPSAQRVDGETVVRIPSFTPGAAAAIRKILEPLDKTHALILDVRNNATGSSKRPRAPRRSSWRRARSASSRAAGSRRRRTAPSRATASTRAASSSSWTAAPPARPSSSRRRCARPPSGLAVPAPKLVREEKAKKEDEEAADADPGARHRQGRREPARPARR